VDIARLSEGLWLVLWAAVALWLVCMLGRRLRRADLAHVIDLEGYELGSDDRGRPCYVPEPGVHVYGVGHRHPISHAPRVCVRRLDGEAVFCDRAGRPLRRLPAGLAGADPELYLPLDAASAGPSERTGRFARSADVIPLRAARR
jgi:hypothetical protein